MPEKFMGTFTSTKLSLGLESSAFRSSGETTLTTGTGEKGSFVEMFSSTNIQANWLTLIVLEPSVKTDYDIDIATGAGGSEVVLIPDVHYHINLTGASEISLPFNFKVDIVAGTRIAARAANPATETIDVEIILIGS